MRKKGWCPKRKRTRSWPKSENRRYPNVRSGSQRHPPILLPHNGAAGNRSHVFSPLPPVERRVQVDAALRSFQEIFQLVQRDRARQDGAGFAERGELMNSAAATGPKNRNGFSSRGFSSPAAQLRLAIQEARSWDGLEALCARIDATYQSGGLDSAAAEELAELTVEVARTVPEMNLGPQSVLAEDLLDEAGDCCPCCGETAWWSKGAQRVCGICHPNPHWEPSAERSMAAPMQGNPENEQRRPFGRLDRQSALRERSAA